MAEKKDDLLNDIKNLTNKILDYIHNDMFQVVGIHLEYRTNDNWYQIKINNQLTIDFIISDFFKTASPLNSSLFFIDENQKKELYKKLVGGGYTFQLEELSYQKSKIESKIKMLEQFKNKIITE